MRRAGMWAARSSIEFSRPSRLLDSKIETSRNVPPTFVDINRLLHRQLLGRIPAVIERVSRGFATSLLDKRSHFTLPRALFSVLSGQTPSEPSILPCANSRPLQCRRAAALPDPRSDGFVTELTEP